MCVPLSRDRSAATERQAHATSPASIARLAVAADADPLAAGGVDTPYLGPISLRHIAGRKGRGYVASADVAAGTLLLVEPALASTDVMDDEEGPGGMLAAGLGGPRGGIGAAAAGGPLGYFERQ